MSLKPEYRFRFWELQSATDNFSRANLRGEGGFGMVYQGKLSEDRGNRNVGIKRLNPDSKQGKREFDTEVKILGSFKHRNIITFIGFCDDDGEMMIVYDYATNKSLDFHLTVEQEERLSSLTWVQRLHICIGAAEGLRCLGEGLGPHRVVHRDFKSANVLLDDDMQAKVSDFGLSKLVPKEVDEVNASVVGTPGYRDQHYLKTGDLTQGHDTYGFGVMLFEVLGGMLNYEVKCVDEKSPRGLFKLIKDYGPHRLDKIIDPCIKDQIALTSFRPFVEIASKCMQDAGKERPTMDRIIKKLRQALTCQEKHELEYEETKEKLPPLHYRIPLLEMMMGTNNFSQENHFASGGFGKVYKGNLFAQGRNRRVAIKRLDTQYGQGLKEFTNEYEMLYRFQHENIIPFVGYCYEGSEMMIASKYAINESLDQHIRDPNKIRCITWLQRLKICKGVAQGLDYLHFGLADDRRVIHRDIKSANILLDENLEAKITDFGLSFFCSRLTEEHIDSPCGTYLYVDPAYVKSGILTKEADVYGFGVVLFEILCGRLAFPPCYDDKGDVQFFISLIKWNYKNNGHIDNMIDSHIRDQTESKSLHTFVEIAFQCIKSNPAKRPTMPQILQKLDQAFAYQWFSLRTLKGKNYLTISATELFKENEENITAWESVPGSRFLKAAKFECLRHFTNIMRISTQMLSLETTYAVYIICRDTYRENSLHTFKRFLLECYYLSEVLVVTLIEQRDDGWIEIELFHFTNHLDIANFEFSLSWHDTNIEDGMYIDGIEFRPIETNIIEEHEGPPSTSRQLVKKPSTMHVKQTKKNANESKLSEQFVKEIHTDWDPMLPMDYQEIMERSSGVQHNITKLELYSFLTTTGIFIDNNAMWLWLNTSNGKKYTTLSPKRLTIIHAKGTQIQNEETRFSLVMAFSKVQSLEIGGKMKAHMLSAMTPYAAFLIFKFVPNRYIPLPSREYTAILSLGKEQKTRRVYLGPSSDVIVPLNDPRSKQGIRLQTTNGRKLDRRSWKRVDGWMEVELFPFFNKMDPDEEVEVGLQINDEYRTAYGFIVQGIEFRPQNV